MVPNPPQGPSPSPGEEGGTRRGKRRRGPGRPPLPPEEVAAQRRRILGAAIAAFAWNGYVGTTISAVAEGAGLSHGLVHHYFRNKAELFSAAVAAGLDYFRAIRQATLEAEGPPEQQLRRYVDATARSLVQSFLFSRLIMQVLGAPGIHPPGTPEMVVHFGEDEAATIQRALQRLGRPVLEADYQSWMTLSTLWGSRMVIIALGDPESWVAFLYQEVCRVLGVAPDPRPEPVPLPPLPWQPVEETTPWSRPDRIFGR